ncbi:isochorismate synthase [Chitinivorax sp. B]|uniref:isochorismate synthase n=1 Tax=Chitinivorax sp. B TaxID=2502235 RepID=UPI0010F4A4F7|nr:isochorismate synthase [Chitinivorax sp. B]
MNDRFREAAALACRPADLLNRYQPGSNLFVSAQRAVLTHGAETILRQATQQGLAQAATAVLADASRDGLPAPMLIGAVPFRGDQPAHLVLPAGAMLGFGLGSSPLMAEQWQAPIPPIGPLAVRCTPSPVGYQQLVSNALSQIRDRLMEKVVLSRSMTVDATVDIPSLLARLAIRSPRGYTFAIEHGETRPSTLVGASPELLLSRRGKLIMSNPLAGSVPRSGDPVEDQRRIEALQQSAKDRHEHALVVDAVAEALRPYCRNLHIPVGPSLLSTPTMWHLSTEITGELIDPAVNSLEIALALHPTPAIGGYPTEPARQFILDHEGFDRGLFTGLVGWCDASGDGEWAVTIRCAEVTEQDVTVFAGAGVVAGSTPLSELNETSAKLRTMLSAMGLEAALEQTA